ncbi:CCGSCS motif protein [Billgrantia montanilacus]|uniref:CCGSCS motif protein n=1 Tax=Billgrantia montanilacus TaxID=2282305 RepID=A0A368U477_9GAMM|nr:CCGSCS motif protein [Halomonas montanilacus]RCV91277.1 CCGSCS motif protein [Halomonas montanilacus]
MGPLKNLFKKGKTEDKPAVQTFEPEASTTPGKDATADEAASADADAVKKAKHGEPGVCCGSCH